MKYLDEITYLTDEQYERLREIVKRPIGNGKPRCVIVPVKVDFTKPKDK